jgi:AraC-like DNA-binding protein/quercetin dioxygenase-like cupin family protein
VTAADISAGHVDWHTNSHPILLWVSTGALTARTRDDEYPVSAGRAVWIPAGVSHAVSLERATVAVAVPSWTRADTLGPERAVVRVIDVPAGLGDWLVHKYYRGPFVEDGPILDLTSGTAAYDAPGVGAAALPAPRSPEARAVTRALLRHPGSPLTMAQFAARESISSRTLHRQFVAETGMTFSRWRTRARIVSAAARIAAGRTIADAARRSGFETAAGFTRAFERHIGLTPSDYAARHRRRGRAARDRSQIESNAHLSALASGQQPLRPLIPAYRGPVRVNDSHVLLWVYRGSAEIHLGHRTRHLVQGQAIWVPAGVSFRVDLAEESILLPLGSRYGRTRIGVDDLRVFSFPPEAESVLLHTTFAEYTLLRPESPLPVTDELFHEQFILTAPGEAEQTGAVGVVAGALRRNPADPRSLADWARTLGTSPGSLGRQFTRQCGMSYRLWRAQLRMHVARELLHLGERPGEVARRLGYASPAGFSKVFVAAHGVPPREFQRSFGTPPGSAPSPAPPL